MRWRSPSNCRYTPWCTRPSRSIRSPTPAVRSRSAVPCSSTPARSRRSTWARLRRSSTTDSTPTHASKRASNSPAGPAPTMATWVCSSCVTWSRGVQIPRLAALARDDGREAALARDDGREAALARDDGREAALARDDNARLPRRCHPERSRGIRTLSRVTPDLARDLGDQMQLGRLVRLAERVPRLGRREAALRAQRQPLEWHDA